MGTALPGGGRREYRSLSEINVTPLVDVMLVLLIIFMVTAPFLEGGLDLRLPQSSSKAASINEGIVIEISRDGDIYVDDRVVAVTGDAKGLAAFEEKLATKHRQALGAPVYLRADESVNYGRVVAVIDIAKKLGIENLGLVTEPGPENGHAPAR
jgi:biopolymer transport protein TolR